MKYLSFDIECCDGVHICEFGYVLFDDSFNMIEKKIFLINPMHKFNLTGRKGHRDLILHFSEEQYNNSPDFSYYYSRIKAIIENPEYTIIGFSMKNDSKFIATACERYFEKPIKFEYYDLQSFYMAYTNSTTCVSIEKIVEELGIKGLSLHKSDDDAYAVMLGLKAIAEKEKMTLPETLKFLQREKGVYNKEKAIIRNKSQREKMLAGNTKAQRDYLKNYIKTIEKDKTNYNTQRKIVTIGANYQKYHFDEFLSLVKLLYKNNYVYSGKASICSVFIKYDYYIDGDLQTDSRLEAIHFENENKTIEIISLEDFLVSFKTNRQQLKASSVLQKKALIKKTYLDKKAPTTMGDMLREKGFDLSSLILNNQKKE